MAVLQLHPLDGADGHSQVAGLDVRLQPGRALELSRDRVGPLDLVELLDVEPGPRRHHHDQDDDGGEVDPHPTVDPRFAPSRAVSPSRGSWSVPWPTSPHTSE